MSVVVPRTSVLTGLLCGGMIFTRFVVLHIRRALASGTASTNETVAVFEALAMSGIGFLVAERRSRG